MITREYKVNNVGQVNIAFQHLGNGAMARIAKNSLKQVLMTKPRTTMIKRTPLATKRRYDYYNRKDGKVTRTKHMSGGVKALRNAVQQNPVMDVPGNPNQVSFGAHATATLDYAPYVHEAIKPREGEYWHERMWGYGRGWTTHDTGNNFVTRAVEEHADYIPEATTRLMDRTLKGMGL